jgi:hypothetical protein
LTHSIANNQIKDWILATLRERDKLFQTEIVDYCSSIKWGSKPTILRFIREFLDCELIEEHSEKSKKGSKGGQPRKYYTLFNEPEKEHFGQKQFKSPVERDITNFQLRMLLDQNKKATDPSEDLWMKNKKVFGIAVNFHNFKAESPIILYPNYLWNQSLLSSGKFDGNALANKSFSAIGEQTFDFKIGKETFVVLGYTFGTEGDSPPPLGGLEYLSICLILKEQWTDSRKNERIPDKIIEWFQTISQLFRENKDFSVIIREIDKIKDIVD